MADQQFATQEDIRRALARNPNRWMGWVAAAALGGAIVGSLGTVGALHKWDCLRFGGVVDGETESSVMAVIEDQRKSNKKRLDDFGRELGVFRDELDSWEHHIERRIGAKPIGAVGSP